MSDLWRDTMIAGFRDAVMQILLVLPRLLALATFLLVGLAMAWLVRALMVRVLTAFRFDRLCERFGLNQPLAQAGIKQPASVVLSRSLVLDGVSALCVHGRGCGESAGHGQSHQPDCGLSAECACGRVGIADRRTVRKFLRGGGADRGGERATAGGTHRGEPGSVGDSLIHVCHGADAVGHCQEIVISAFSITFGGVVFSLALGVGLGIRHLMRETIERRLGKGKEKEEKIDELSHL